MMNAMIQALTVSMQQKLPECATLKVSTTTVWMIHVSTTVKYVESSVDSMRDFLIAVADYVDLQSGVLNTSCHAQADRFVTPQGVLASGLGALWKATGNRTLLKEAEITLDATIKDMTVNGVLKESCDSVIETDDPCDIDQVGSLTLLFVRM